MVVLSILGTSYFHLTTLEFMTTRNDLDKYEAELLAESALYLAIADLKDESSKGKLDLSGDWSGAGKLFEEATLGNGLFQIYTDDVYSEEGGTLFGLRDESSKLNLNTATKEMLEKLPGMNSARASALIDWRDTDDKLTRGGAEEDYYGELTPPYAPRNAPLKTIEEILQIKGFTPRRFFGEDANRDGNLQSNENDGNENDPPDNKDGKLDRGLLPFVTIYSYDKNVNEEGLKRLNINTASMDEIRERLKGKVPEDKLTQLDTQRQKKKFESLTDLLTGVDEKSEKKNEGKTNSRNRRKSGGQRTEPENRESESPPASAGKLPANALVTEDEFKIVCDEFTLDDKESLPGLVNINTAPKEVLICLPGMTENRVESILSRRGADQQGFTSVADLLSVEGIDVETFAQLFPLITVRPYVFEARAVGYVPETKAYASIMAIIDRGSGTGKFLYYRVLR
jgi:DNA uptake protein ComE-like DNA-binding protein